MRKAEAASLLIVLLSFVLGMYLYPHMPEQMASHWNIQGIVDGYMSKFWGLFLMPLISLGLFLLFITIPRIEPKKANIEKFRSYFDMFVFLVMLFLLYIYTLTIAWNAGLRFSMVQLLSPAFALLFYYCGILVGKAKRNWFIGIRTPWTMSSDKVWDSTHRLGAKLFKLSGIISLLGVPLPEYALFFILIPVIFSAVYAIVYSYVEYSKQTRKRK